MKNIIILGDSFVYGEGCSDRTRAIIENLNPAEPSDFCWPSLLKKELEKEEYELTDCNIVNLSVPGNSLSGTLMDLSKFKENVPRFNIDMVIMSVTSCDRMMIPAPFNPDDITNWVLGSTAGIKGSDEYQKSKEYFLKYLVNDEIMEFNSVIQLLALEYYCVHICNVPLLWSIADSSLIHRIRKSTWHSIRGHSFSHMFGLQYIDGMTKGGEEYKKFYPLYTVPDGHPNDAGQQHYFETYIKPTLIPKIKYALTESTAGRFV